MAQAGCTFVPQYPGSLVIRYQTQTFVTGPSSQVSNIYYRINEGSWNTIPNIVAGIGPGYDPVLVTTANINDKVDYYFSSNPQYFVYGVGFNGPYSGALNVNTITIAPGTNFIDFNICDFTIDSMNANFCPPYE